MTSSWGISVISSFSVELVKTSCKFLLSSFTFKSWIGLSKTVDIKHELKVTHMDRLGTSHGG